MARRRGNHEGTIYQRKDGAWAGQVSIGYDPSTGKPKRQTFYGKTRREVADKIAQALHEQNIGAYIKPDKITLGEWLQRWLHDYKKLEVRDTTYSNYEMVIRLYLIPPLGCVALRQLQTADIQAVFTSMTQRGLSRRTVELTRTTIRAALNQALKEGMIIRNVADATKLPMKDEQDEEEPYFTKEEAMQLLDTAKDDRLFAAYHTLLLTGLRRGEMLGLKRDDLDLKAKTLTVRRCLVEVKHPETGKVTLDYHSPKTRKSGATIPLDDELVKSLKAHLARQAEERLFFGKAYQDNGLVFCTEEGKPIWPRNFNSRYERLLKKAGLPYRKPHSTRHTFCTLLLEAGEDLVTISELARHASIQVTGDIYSHVIDRTKRKAVGKLGQILKAEGE